MNINYESNGSWETIKNALNFNQSRWKQLQKKNIYVWETCQEYIIRNISNFLRSK